MGKDKHNAGLDALKAIKKQVPSSVVVKALAGKPRRAPEVASPSAEPDEAGLFRQQVGAVQPVRGGGQADIARPRPAPVPRPRLAEPEPEAPRRSHRVDENDPMAVFRAALGDIAPIKDFNRVDLSQQRQQANPQVRAVDNWVPPPSLLDGPVSHDPAELFRQVAGAVAPLKDKNLADVERPVPAPRPRQREEDEREVLREAIETPLSFEDRLDTGDEAAYLRTGLPRRVLTDLRRGRWVVQGELDLHGLTRDEARASLARFIALSLQQGRRCLRVIHGKGHGSPGRMPVLKHLSRGWLAQREDILAFCQARPHDGGDGALLVLLQAGVAKT
ncbi:MAG: DNA mismatch repair protein MutS [Zoogloea sp.]|jgi:DNA-nicking Smr family endonuclease|uniref:Smr/MutS family protein n=1 Tax=Zoogloea sp. TaxID=49181 RepID=UPI0011D5DD88|nr:MAG: DNA mismatch repair protein MutS [Zoogloea sp.]